MKHSFMVEILCVSIMLFSFNCFADTQCPEVTIKPFPIMSWVPPALTEQQLDWYNYAGFNVMFIYPHEESYQTMKKNWDGMWMVFKEWNPYEYDYKTMCDFHADDPQRIGFMLGDEPTTPEIDDYVEQFNYLRQRHPDDICLINLFPSYVSESRLGSTYRDYIEIAYEKLRPRYISLDSYPCRTLNYDTTCYYHDLEIMRQQAQKHNTNVFGFVQVYSRMVFRDVSESDLAWQVNTLLAYGCKGLWYFYYRHPVTGINELTNSKEARKRQKMDYIINYHEGRTTEKADNVYFFGSGVLDYGDVKGERFEDVAQVNKETLAWGDVLLGLDNLYIRHIRGFKEGEVPVGTDEFARNDDHLAREGAFTAEEYIVNVSATEPSKSMGYIISCFKDKQKRPYVMIVNKRHGEGMSRTEGLVETKIKFSSDVKNVYSVSNQTSKEEKMELDSTHSFKCNLEGGCAVLLRLDVSSSHRGT